MPLPPTACCRKCYYPLAGAAPGRCPECGREFDLSDPKSYLAKPPSKWKWPRRIAAVVLGAGAGYAFMPAGCATSHLRLVDSENRGDVFTRYTLLPPSWIGNAQYPYWTFHEHRENERLAALSESQDVTAETKMLYNAINSHHSYRHLSTEFSAWRGSNPTTISLQRTTPAGLVVEIDGLPCTTSNVARVLDYVSRRDILRTWGGVEIRLVTP